MFKKKNVGENQKNTGHLGNFAQDIWGNQKPLVKVGDYVSRGVVLHDLSLDVKNIWRKKAYLSHDLILSEIGGQARLIYDLIIRLKQQYVLR